MTENVSWYITFGFGGPYAGQYTEVRVPANLPVQDQEMRVRMKAFELYDKAWAFDYAPEQYERCIARYGMKLREIVRA